MAWSIEFKQQEFNRQVSGSKYLRFRRNLPKIKQTRSVWFVTLTYESEGAHLLSWTYEIYDSN